MSLYTSEICLRCDFISPNALYGHRRSCYNVLCDLNFDETTITIEPYNITEFGDVLPLIQKACRTYLRKQRLTLSADMVNCIRSGFPKLLSGCRLQGSIRIYLEIAKFITSCVSLSGSESDGLLALICTVSHLNGKEIPLPGRYRSLVSGLLKNTSDVSSVIVQSEFPMSRTMFGKALATEMPKAKGVVIDLVKLVGNSLLHVTIRKFYVISLC